MSSPNHYKLWTSDEDTYLRERYTHDGVELCAQHLGRTKDSTWNRTNLLGLRHQRRHPTPMRMDRIKTPVFAYVLGYLWADGSAIKNRYGVAMCLQYHDGAAIKPHMEYTGGWHRRKARGPTQNQLCYEVWDRPFVKLLRELGFGPSHKSERPFNLVCEYLGPELVPYFVHGFFDGDGCIASTTRVKRYTVTFAGPVSCDWSYLIGLLKDAGIGKVSLYKATNHLGRSSSLFFCRQADVLRFYAAFIHGHEVGLERKTKRFRAFVQKLKAPRPLHRHGGHGAKITEVMRLDLDRVTEAVTLRSAVPTGRRRATCRDT